MPWDLKTQRDANIRATLEAGLAYPQALFFSFFFLRILTAFS